MFCMLRCMYLVYVLYVEMYVSGICSVCWDVCVWYMFFMLRCMYLVYVLYVEMYVSGICSVCWDVWIWYICFNVYQIIDKEEKEGLFSFFSQHLQCSTIYCGETCSSILFYHGNKFILIDHIILLATSLSYYWPHYTPSYHIISLLPHYILSYHTISLVTTL